MNLKSEKFSRILEIVVVVFLGIASVFSAFSAWQSALNGSAMSKEYNEGIATITDANSLYVEAGQVVSSDMSLYMQLISLQNDWTFSEEGSAEEAKAEEVYNQFANKFITEELDAAITWAEEQENETGTYVSPFASEAYVDAVYADANEQYAIGRERLELGHKYNTYGDKMGLIVIYFATVMFLLGICGTLKNATLKLSLTIFSFAIFVFAVVQMCGIPFLAA